MGAQVKKWIVRSSDGHIYGPFEALKVGELLGKGVFTGEEQVAIYPAGDWISMSGDSELYNLVLQSLSGNPPRQSINQEQEKKNSPQESPKEPNTQTGTGSVSTRKFIEKQPGEAVRF